MVAGVNLLAFIGVSLVVICTPGQDTALTVRNSLLGGRQGGVGTAVGVASGQAVWTLATAAGLAVLLAASEPVFNAIRFAGAGYLLYLGGRSLLIALRGQHDQGPAGPQSARRLSFGQAARQGLLSNIANPKMVAFFTGLLPQFVPARPSFAALFALGISFCLMTMAWLTAYAFAVERARGLLLRSRVRRAMDALLGTVLIGLGLRVATSRA